MPFEQKLLPNAHKQSPIFIIQTITTNKALNKVNVITIFQTFWQVICRFSYVPIRS
jgi:hypothetical protein